MNIKIAPEAAKLRVPSLILQPLVENAVKHGVTAKRDGGTISVVARQTARNLILQVADTGAGISEKELRSRRESRVGLNNVEQRLRLSFDGGASLQIKSRTGTGTTARIEISLKNFPAAAPPRIAEKAIHKLII